MSRITAERSIDSLKSAKVFLDHIGYYDCISEDGYVKNIVLNAYKKEKLKKGKKTEEPREYELFDFCAKKLFLAEKELSKLGSKTTLRDDNARKKKYRLNSDRDHLKDTIIKECMSLLREDDETRIETENGVIEESIEGEIDLIH